MNPAPANPFCWSLIRLEADPARDLYRAVASADLLLPGHWAQFVCPKIRSEPSTFQHSLATFRAAYGIDCELEAWLRFARAPILTNGAALDLRFANGFRDNFTELATVGTNRACPPFLPDWDHPRQDLIDLAN